MNRGHVCPSIVAHTSVQREVLAAVVERGLTLQRVHPDRPALRLTGGPDGMYLTVAELWSLSLADLRPPTAGELRARGQLIRGA